MKGKIKEFWEKQAIDHGNSYKATIPDKYLKELETEAIVGYIPNAGLVGDIGCGNGLSELCYAKMRQNVTFECFDYSKQMIDIAERERSQAKVTNISFTVLDIEQFDFINKYDRVITDRCLINLTDENSQTESIVRIIKSLKSDGKYIMCEDTIQGLDKLNKLRIAVGLEEIKVRWHNRYIDEDILFRLEREGIISIETTDCFSALYYVASRVINGRMAKDNNIEPEYESPVNRIGKDISLLSNFGDCTPLKIFVLGKGDSLGD